MCCSAVQVGIGGRATQNVIFQSVHGKAKKKRKRVGGDCTDMPLNDAIVILLMQQACRFLRDPGLWHHAGPHRHHE